MHDELLERYLAGANDLRAAIDGMSPDQLAARPVEGKWSTRDVVCHIADFEPVYADRMTRVIAEDRPPLRGGDPDEFAAKLAYDARDIEEELQLVDAVRRHTARILKAVPAEAFDRVGIHSRDGEITLLELLERITNHVPHHVTFIDEKRRALGV